MTVGQQGVREDGVVGVERGLVWLRDHPSVARLRVGLGGASNGGESALLAASRFSE
jgi:hypothetical protein